MDSIVSRISDYAHALRFEDLPAAVVHHCKRCVIDSIGVALGAYDADPCRIARDIAARASVPGGARVLGSSQRTLPELAAFANVVMTRYLDGNDSYLGGGGHPSDTIAAIFAVADVERSDGRQIITAIALAYEIYHNFWKTSGARQQGLDNVFYVSVGSAVGAAKVLGLDAARIADALSLGITPNIPLDATRHGLLSMWKGCAAGNAARNGVFAALLAAAGVTGPEKPIEGGHGLQKWVGNFELAPFGGATRPFGICDITLKGYFAVAHALSPITAALELSRQVALNEIERVTLYTYQYAREMTGKEAEKWRPTTREAADHSLPYIVAVVLINGKFNDELFSREWLADVRVHQLIDKIAVEEDPELTRQFPEKVPCRIEIVTKSGERKIASTDYPRGHFRNPMSDVEVSDKFRALARRALPPQRIAPALDVLWHLDTAANLDALFDALKI
jgi:2-methylcitrate dehydratase